MSNSLHYGVNLILLKCAIPFTQICVSKNFCSVYLPKSCKKTFENYKNPSKIRPPDFSGRFSEIMKNKNKQTNKQKTNVFFKLDIFRKLRITVTSSSETFPCLISFQPVLAYLYLLKTSEKVF